MNTTSTADISFMLLIFFLVVSSLDDSDKVLSKQLPPPDNKTEVEELVVKQRNALVLKLGDDNTLTCNGEPIEMEVLPQRIEAFVANENNDPALPEKSQREVHLLGLCQVSDRHVIMLETSRQATYNAYFDIQNVIAAAYNHLRDNLAQQRFGHALRQCSQEELDAIQMVYPQRISEHDLEITEGGDL